MHAMSRHVPTSIGGRGQFVISLLLASLLLSAGATASSNTTYQPIVWSPGLDEIATPTASGSDLGTSIIPLLTNCGTQLALTGDAGPEEGNPYPQSGIAQPHITDCPVRFRSVVVNLVMVDYGITPLSSAVVASDSAATESDPDDTDGLTAAEVNAVIADGLQWISFTGNSELDLHGPGSRMEWVATVHIETMSGDDGIACSKQVAIHPLGPEQEECGADDLARLLGVPIPTL